MLDNDIYGNKIKDRRNEIHAISVELGTRLSSLFASFNQEYSAIS